jgi:DNA-binding MarR family transcriptional regulator
MEVAMTEAQSRELLDGARDATIGTLLRQVFTRFSTGTPGQRSRDFVVLDMLSTQDAASQQDLANRIDVNRTIMVKLIDRLQDAGYVTRTRNPANRRTYVLSLTERGRGALDDFRVAAAEQDARITAALSTAERHRLTLLLNHLLSEPEPDQAAIASVEHLITQALYRLRRIGDHMLAGSGLRTRHFGVLAALDLFGPCPQQQVARELAISEPTMAQHVDELVHMGLVSRGQDPHDRRRYALAITDLGRERIPLLLKAMRHVEAEVSDTIGPDGRQELHALLVKILR